MLYKTIWIYVMLGKNYHIGRDLLPQPTYNIIRKTRRVQFFMSKNFRNL